MAHTPKIAIVCDWLTEVGGAERVILAVHQMYPDAPIYTSQYRPKRAPWFDSADVRTGWINILPVGLKRFIPFLRNIYFYFLNLKEYDIIISITGAEAKAVRKGKHAVHISYMHAPTQYYWSLYDDYMKQPGFGVLNPIVRIALWLLVRPLRRVDYNAAQRPDVIVSNSSYIQGEIKKFYNRDSVVVWPNVAVKDIMTVYKKQQNLKQKRSGFIVFGRQVSWKRLDIAIKAAIKLKKNLIVAGSGPENNRLKEIAAGSPYVTFIPRYNGVEELVPLIVKSEAFIFPSLEPFGIAPVEALAAGTPVIGLGKGGALDIIKPGKNGTFFEKQTVASLVAAMKKFKNSDYDIKTIQKSALQFSEESFKQQMKEIIEEASYGGRS